MNITEKYGDKTIISTDKLFCASVSHTFTVSDKDEKNPIPYINIRENTKEDNNGPLASIYFDNSLTNFRPENEVVIHGNYGNQLSHFRMSVEKLCLMATFIKDVRDYILHNPKILSEATYN
jgi:hypothetical protein